MKFSIALGLLFAGLAHSQHLEPVQARIDSFLRESQHLKPTAQLVSAKQNGSISTVTYQDGPMNMKYEVKTENNDMKIVGIEQIVSFSSNLQFQPNSIQDVPQNHNDIKLPPLPLIMPQFTIQPNGEISSTNVFEEVGKEMEEMKKMMKLDRQNFQQMMEQKRLEMQQRFKKNFDTAIKETPLLGAGNHDYNEATNIQLDQPLIEGDHDYNWATQIEDDHPIVGGGDHDYTWMTVQIEPSQPLLGAGDHDFEFIPQGPLIGGGEHDNWIERSRQVQEFDHPIIGGDDHDNWKVNRENHNKNLKENHVGKGKHDNWRHHNKFQGGQKRHHSSMAWMNRVFTGEEVTPFLKEKLPDMMKNAEIISVQNKGFLKRQGFPLDIQITDKDGNIENISVYFKPRQQELLIAKISTVQKVESQNILPVELASESKAEKKEIPVENLVAPKFIPEASKPSLLGGEEDPDNSPEFMNFVKQIEFTQNNHISHQRAEQILQVAILGGESDVDHKIEQVALLGGQSDHDNVQKVVEKTEQKSEPVFDVTGLPLPGGDTDVDPTMGLDLIQKVFKMVTDISEEVEDIDEVQEVEEKPTTEKLQHLIK